MRSDKTALQIASHQGFSGVVEFLVQLGANVNLQVSVTTMMNTEFLIMLM